MDLIQKGAAKLIEAFKQLMIIMSWTSEADFDLCGLYKAKDGSQGLVYFGGHQNTKGRNNQTVNPDDEDSPRGFIDQFPFIQLSGDAGAGDTGGDNQETMLITEQALQEMDEIFVFCWDYGMVKVGSPARFGESDIALTIRDDTGGTDTVKPESGMLGNVSVIAKIDNTGSSPQLINVSTVGTLKGLNNFEELLAIANQ